MLRNDALLGSLSQYDHPDWKPLERLIGVELAGFFMWMCEIELSDGTYVQAYKHCLTRRYLHLSDDGRAFTYREDDTYPEIGTLQAIDCAFVGWESLASEPSDADLAQLEQARARAAQRRI